MEKLKKYKLECILFNVEAICMILELLASRLLSPYFGISNIVWTTVIGIILLSSSLGNYIGGKIADRNKKLNEILKMVLVISGILILAIPMIQSTIIEVIKELNMDIRIGAIISTILLFFSPNLFLGFLIPIVLKIKLTNFEESGNITGRTYAISTLGGIVGTFIGGFFLVPHFGSIQILIGLPIFLFILSFVLDNKLSLKGNIVQIIAIILSVIYIVLSSNSNEINAKKVLEGQLNTSVSYDTQYDRVLIRNIDYNGIPVRIMNVGIGFESISYIAENMKYELFSDYLKAYDLMFKSKNNINNCLMIGGAGYAYPKYYISHYLDKTLDVVEIDGEVTNLAKEFFYLDDLFEDYDLNNNNRLNLITDDGRTFLNTNNKKYDAIMNDAFSGETPAKTLTTLEAAKLIKNSLNDDGLYLTNIIGSIEGNNSKFLKAEVNTLKQVFKNVYVISLNTLDKNAKANYMVICTDQDIPFDNVVQLDILPNEIILTDNYAPIDTLIPSENG